MTDNNYTEEADAISQARRKQNKNKSGGFQSMGLSPSVLKGVTRRGYKIPTPIQRKTIPLILEGHDLVAMARTGSGKTAAFLIPMFEKLRDHKSGGARAIVLSPTRELAAQTLKFAKELGKFTGLRAAVILGGDKMDEQFAALHDNPDLIIATPGRFMHVVVEMELKLSSVEYVVFDEADRLFEMGFREQLQEVIHRLPGGRQTLLFSATLPKLVVEFSRARLSDPTLVRLDVDSKLSENLQLCFLRCRETEKCAILLYLLNDVIKKGEQTVIFAATKHHVEFLNLLLTNAGHSVTYIYSSLDQAARKINAAKFSLGKVKILIVTDLAARGIDVPLLDNVINFNFPGKPKLFVHRVGRVARAGRCGIAYSLTSPDELAHLFDLHTFLGRPMKVVPLTGPRGDVDQDSLGEVPQSIVDDNDVKVKDILSRSVDLTNMEKVCDNAYRKYLKSRPAPAPDSIKRVKELVRDGFNVGIHPMFDKVQVEEQGARLNMLNALKNFKPRTTIFEINSTSKKAGLKVMQDKRRQHERVIEENRLRQAERRDTLAIGSESTRVKRKHDADESDINSTFKSIVSSQQSKLRKKEKKPVKDEENYINYQPADFSSERGLSITSQFEKDAADAVLDFTADDNNNQGQTKKRRWDRKKKKFVTEQTEGRDKKIKTESGNWIPSSYKSNAYEDWRKRTKQDEQEANDDGNRRSDGKFSISGMRKRRWHTKGKDDQEKSSKNKFKKGRELRKPEQILKQRRKKAKIQNFQNRRADQRAKRQGKEAAGGKGRGGKRKH